MDKLLVCVALSILMISAVSAETMYWSTRDLDGKYASTILIYDIPASSQKCRGKVAASIITSSTGTNVHEGCWVSTPNGIEIKYKESGDIVAIPAHDLRRLEVSR
ncbi:hypothetical protein [Paraburkholderia xenovorans]